MRQSENHLLEQDKVAIFFPEKYINKWVDSGFGCISFSSTLKISSGCNCNFNSLLPYRFRDIKFLKLSNSYPPQKVCWGDRDLFQ